MVVSMKSVIDSLHGSSLDWVLKSPPSTFSHQNLLLKFCFDPEIGQMSASTEILGHVLVGYEAPPI